MRLLPILLLIGLCALGPAAHAAEKVSGTFVLTNGTEVTGTIFKVRGTGITFRNEKGSLMKSIKFGQFKKESLKKLVEASPDVRQHAGHLLAAGAVSGAGSAIAVKPPPARESLDPPAYTDVEDRPELPEAKGIFGAYFGTKPGLLMLFLIWGANLWAAHNIGVYRRWPKFMVPGIAAVAPLVGPAVILAMKPKKVEKKETVMAKEDEEKPAKKKAAVAKPVSKAKVVTAKPGAAAGGAGARAGAGAAKAKQAQAQAPMAAPPQPGAAAAAPKALEAASYEKGSVNINKRFIETKFAPFFKLVPDEPYRSGWMCFVTPRGEYWAKRIPKITQTDLTIQCPQEGGGTLDQTIQIAEITAIHIRPGE